MMYGKRATTNVILAKHRCLEHDHNTDSEDEIISQQSEIPDYVPEEL